MKRIFCLFVLLAGANAGLAQPRAVPDTLDAHDVTDPDSLARMQACTPRASSAFVEEARKRAWSAQRSEVTLVAEPGARQALVERGGVWTCLPLSQARLPLLPVDMILRVVRPQGAEAALSNEYARSISAALAEAGYARGLIVMDNGNAFAVLYAVSAEKPYELAYDDRFMKAGQFNPADYAIKLSGAQIRTVATATFGGVKRVDVLTNRQPTRQIVDNYLVRPGNARTTAFKFGGSTWISMGFPRSTYSFEPDGSVVFRSRISTSFGVWRVKDGTLYYEVNNFAYSSAIIDDDGYLTVESRSRPNAGLPAGVPQVDTSVLDNRYRFRLYQQGNAAAEKAVNDQAESLSRAFQFLLDAERQRVLAEGPADEARVLSKRQSLCSTELSLMASSVAEFRNTTVGELCSSYLGERREWKQTILVEGCKGRCLRF